MENENDIVTAREHPNDPRLDDIFHMLIRWEGGKIIKHLDTSLLSRLIRERNEMNEQYSLQQDLIAVLLIKQQQNERILAHFDATDKEFIDRRIKKRLIDRANEALLWDEFNEPIL